MTARKRRCVVVTGPDAWLQLAPLIDSGELTLEDAVAVADFAEMLSRLPPTEDTGDSRRTERRPESAR